jgi:hypothetical protein
MMILPRKRKKDEDEEPHILSDFSACMYNIEDKQAFEEAFMQHEK